MRMTCDANGWCQVFRKARPKQPHLVNHTLECLAKQRKGKTMAQTYGRPAPKEIAA